LRPFGADVWVCAPPDWAERLAQFGVAAADGATVAATPLLDAVSRERRPVSA
jgi:hypothetical protein